MDLYTDVSYEISETVTKRYSTSFSASTRLFDSAIRPHIYAIYGLVRIADEVVDTNSLAHSEKILRELQADVFTALKRGYSTNPVIHSFITTAAVYKIDASLITPFFESMEMDLHPKLYTDALYQQYIYGSAEVIGLMCLRVFCQGDDALYKKLEKGASALGAAYQKVNFLRDIAADYKELGRTYFPGVSFAELNETHKHHIIADIEHDFSIAKKALQALPDSSRKAVEMSVVYYDALLRKLKKTPMSVIKQRRIRINNISKALLFVAPKGKTLHRGR